MTIDLPQDLALFVQEAIRTGDYSSEQDVVRDALARLRQARAEAPPTDSSIERASRLTKSALRSHLVKIGVMDEPPRPGADSPDADPTAINEEEIISEAVIRERLIEWLTSFL